MGDVWKTVGQYAAAASPRRRRNRTCWVGGFTDPWRYRCDVRERQREASFGHALDMIMIIGGGSIPLICLWWATVLHADSEGCYLCCQHPLPNLAIRKHLKRRAVMAPRHGQSLLSIG